MTDRDDYKRLADRLDRFARILEGARKHENNNLSVWSSDPALMAEAASALRAASVKAGEPCAPVMCIGWETIRRLASGESVWFDDLKCGAIAADDLIGATIPPAPTASVGAMRACTCHPDDNPPKPCPQRFAYSECLAAANQPDVEELAATSAERPGTVTSEPEPSTSDPFAGKVPCHCYDPVSQRLCLDKDRCYTVEAQGGPSDTPPAPQADYITTHFNEVTCERTADCTWPDCKCPRKTSPTPQAVDAVPYAWVIPGDGQARDNGFIDAMICEEGEFTKPLYEHPPTRAAVEAMSVDEVTWQQLDSAPRDGTPINVRAVSTYRYQPYKPNSGQRKKGIRGRWQVVNEYGGWANCPEPCGEWSHLLAKFKMEGR